jgi:NAD(P)H-dependent flavin oxidoreductase YrpB (nitropropane dioxygenase family)
MKTRITDLFGIKYPIQCGGMLWIAKPELAAAISNTGAMGNLTSGNYNSADAFRTAVDATRNLTDKPFIVNITTESKRSGEYSGAGGGRYGRRQKPGRRPCPGCGRYHDGYAVSGHQRKWHSS